MKKTPYDRYFHRTRILMAAAEVFAERGASGAAIEELLVKAKVSRRTFYRYFKNREEVLLGLYEVATDSLLTALREAVSQGKSRMDKLTRCVDVYLEAHQRAGRLMRVLAAESVRPGSPLTARRDQMLALAAAELSSELAVRGRGPDPLVIEGAVVALEGILWRVGAAGKDTRPQLARARAAMLRALLAPLARPGDRVPRLPVSTAKHAR